MKKLFFMVIGFMFAVQTAFASPAGDKMNFETLNKTDAQILFQDDVTSRQEIIVLDVNQMNELKAKGWWHRIRRRFSHVVRSIQHGLGRLDNFTDRVFGIKNNYSDGQRRNFEDNMNNNHGHPQVGYTWHFKRRYYH